MTGKFSDELLQKVYVMVRSAVEREGVLNVPEIAMQVKARFPNEHISIGDIEAKVMSVGQGLNAAMLFQHASDETRPDAE